MFITSGIINTKEQDVKDAMNANPELEIVETTYHGGDWHPLPPAENKEQQRVSFL